MKKKAFLTTLPDFIEIQRTSFCWFLEKGLSEELAKFPSITYLDKRIELDFFGQEYKIQQPKYSFMKSKFSDTTYAIKIYVPITIRCFNKPLKTKMNLCIGEVPLMSEAGIFLINGCERVVINQIIRSPGVYYTEVCKKGVILYRATVIPTKGSWLRFGIDESKQITVCMDQMEDTEIMNCLRVFNLPLNEMLNSFKYPFFFIRHLKMHYKKYATYEREQFSEFFTKQILNPQLYTLGRIGRSRFNNRFNLNIPNHVYTLTSKDILSIIDGLINLEYSDGNIEYLYGNLDDIDHLQNRRVRSVGELLQIQFRSGLIRLKRLLFETLLVDLDTLKIKNLVFTKPIVSMMREFFGSSQLSQFFNQTNPLSALTHKRRISGLGLGGFNRDHVSFAVRDIHPSHYGRICPVETAEGQNAGLISSLSVYARVNSFGFIETPFFCVNNGVVLQEKPVIYLTADEEDKQNVAPADTSIDANGKIKLELITVRYNQEFFSRLTKKIQLVSVSPVQSLSSATTLIPFLEHNDATRVLMGANMQRQAVPLLFPSKAIIGTGLENQLAGDIGMVVISYDVGHVISVSNTFIKIKNRAGKIALYTLFKYNRSNQDTCVNQRPLVWTGESIEYGQIIADGPGTESGEIALGQNLLVAYMTWEGYNYEDAILINQRLVYADLFTSIHIEKYDVDVLETLEGTEEITNDIPNVENHLTKNLDENGIIYRGTFVHSGEILVGKVTPSDSLARSHQRIIQVILQKKVSFEIDTSLRVPHRSYGRVIDVRILSHENDDELPISTNMRISVFLAQIKKIKIGDKMSGRHGNKGIISRILRREDMPYLPNGTSIDLILNPLGVPSRMNVGQLFEGLFGFAGDIMDKRYKVMPFDEMYGIDASRILINNSLNKAKKISNFFWVYSNDSPGKICLKDGRTGQLFDNPITICKSYMLKLIHLVDDKIHARSVGPYSLITQQPLKGRSNQGGQRFGEMEVWALEAFGAAHTLQEILTYKSDDINGRDRVAEAILKGREIPEPGIPESFKVLILELKAIGLDITINKIEKKINGDIDNLEINILQESKLLPTYKSLETT